MTTRGGHNAAGNRNVSASLRTGVIASLILPAAATDTGTIGAALCNNRTAGNSNAAVYTHIITRPVSATAADTCASTCGDRSNRTAGNQNRTGIAISAAADTCTITHSLYFTTGNRDGLHAILSVCTADTSRTSAFLVNLSRRSNNFSAIDYNLAVIVAAADAWATIVGSLGASCFNNTACDSNITNTVVLRIIPSTINTARADTRRLGRVTKAMTISSAANSSQFTRIFLTAVNRQSCIFADPKACTADTRRSVINQAGLERVHALIRQHQRHIAAFNGKSAGDAFCLCRQINVHIIQGDLMITSGDSDGVRGASFAGLRNDISTRVLNFSLLITLRISSRRDDDRAISQIKLAIRSVHGSGSLLLAVLRRGLCGVLSFLRVATARVPCQNRRWQQTQHHDKRHYTCQ